MEEDTTLSAFGDLLKAFRKREKVTQQELASRMNVHRNTIGIWERGDFLPESKTIVLELAKQLHLEENETRQILEASLTAVSQCWNVPYQRNPFFTGREEILQRLHTLLRSERTAAITQSHALSGLGGIGKTQTAIEYAYRYPSEYASVFWIGADTYETLSSSFISVAEVLNLPERREQDQSKIVAAVIRWLNSHRDWLLIFDNVEDIEMVKRFFPPSRAGAILLTTRIHALGTLAHNIELAQMTRDEGILLLSRRAKLLHPYASQDILSPTDAEIARKIVELMDGLPLALDQAGSYIEATQCNLSDYQRLFQSSRLRLLDERDAYADHALSVTRTFTLAFERLQQSNAAAAELLTVCAFLAPEAIPESFFIEGAAHLGQTFESLAVDPLQFNDAIKTLLTYSLLQRNATAQTVTIHRLVQAVLKESLNVAIQREWVTRILRTMVHLFPSDKIQTDYLQICERLLPHALMCIALADQWREKVLEHVELMNNVATYLKNRARFVEADMLYQKALHIGEQLVSSEHLLVAKSLHGLAELYREQGKYEEAEPLYQRALYIEEQVLETEHPFITETLSKLAELYREQGRYQEAEPLLQRALRIGEHTLGFKIASPLHGLATLYGQQGKYEEAKPLLQRALHIWEQALGPEHLQITHVLNDLGVLHQQQSKYEEAELYFQRALHIREQALGSEHPDVAFSLYNLAELFLEKGKLQEAELLFLRALRIQEHALGPQHPRVAKSLNGLADLYREQGRYQEAEPLLQRALHIKEQALGTQHPDVAYPLNDLANLYRDQGKYEKAKAFYQRALHNRGYDHGGEHPEIAKILHDFAASHSIEGNRDEAASLYQRALTIREQVFGPGHPMTATTRTAYTHLLREMGRTDEATMIEAQVSEETISR